MSEKEIVAGIQQHNQNAFRALVDKYQEMVLNTCNGFVHDQDDARDLTQDVFVEVFNSIHKFRGDAKLSTWLYRMAVNRSLNFIRKHKRRQLFGDIESFFKSNSVEEELITTNAEVGMEQNEQAKILHKAIQSLPQNQKIAFTLHKIEGVSYNEISEIMSVSLSSVESLIHRARKSLKIKLLDYYKKNML